ncbi:MAG: DNA polymerase III subunit [Candidatus Nealsonbacteria bacterium]|nr:DNA polymerase III subunit [Candidatus Nealsonbacteria bacterium]
MENQWQYLKMLVETGKLPHAFLFSGSNGSENKEIAHDFIKLLHCQEKDFSKKPCGACRSCADIERQMHPDSVLIDSQEEEIPISKIRELKDCFSLKPFLGQIKTAVIANAHLMNREAQSSFLKLLEEPKGNALFILATEYPEMLLPTILSRVEKVRLFTVSKTKKEDQQNKFCKKTTQDFTRLAESDLGYRFEAAKELSGSPQLQEVLQIWMGHLREVLLLKAKNPENNMNLNKLAETIKLIQRIHFLLATTNVNPRLALETLMLGI